MNGRFSSRAAVIAVGLALGVAPALAQNVQGNTGNSKTNDTAGMQASQTGAGPRGTTVGPSTEPGQPNQPATAETGVPPRGTKAAPSTNPAQGGQHQ